MIENFPVSLAYFVRRETWPGWKIEPRTIPNHELVLVLSGRGEARIKGRIHPLGTGSFLYFRPGLLHDMKTDDSDCLVFYAVHFDTDSALPELPHCFRLQNSRRIVELFRSIDAVHGRGIYLRRWQENLLLQSILLEIHLELHRAAAHNYTELRLRRAIACIHDNPTRHISVDELLRQSGMGKSAFFQAFRQLTGTSPARYADRVRLEHARGLLLGTAAMKIPFTSAAASVRNSACLPGNTGRQTRSNRAVMPAPFPPFSARQEASSLPYPETPG